MRPSGRSGSVQRSGSAQRTRPAVPANIAVSIGGGRPPSRSPPNEALQASPVTSDAGDVPRSGGRRGASPDPLKVHGHGHQADGHVQLRRVSAGGSRPGLPGVPHVTPTTTASRSGASARAGSQGATARTGSKQAGDVARSAIFAYLKVYGLNQYARAFIEVGLGDLDTVSRLSETEALESLERLRVYPGHRLRLLRAVDCLRNAALGAEKRDAAQMLEDDAALERLCAQNEELSKEKVETQGENKRLQEENERLLGVVRQQDGQLQKAKDRMAELEELVQTQTEQVEFLAQQLQLVAGDDTQRQSQLFKSYRDTHDVDDWSEAARINLPESTGLPNLQDTGDLTKQRAFTPEDFARATLAAAQAAEAAAHSAPASAPAGTRRPRQAAMPDRRAGGEAEAPFSPPRRAKMAQSLDSAQIRECLAGFDVDHIIRCLATALHNKLILTVAKSRPHSASEDYLTACAIYLEPACKKRLEEALGGGPAQQLRDTMGKAVHHLNAIAVRSVPNKWDVYGFLRDVMVNFRLEPEVSVITLFYIDRFSEACGVALTPDNWQRLTIAAMMLASKVWNDESFENVEFAQLCPLYTLDEINAFERIFLKCVGYNMSVKGSQYAKTYFLLRTLGAKDAADFALEPLNELRATRLAEKCLEKQIEFRERYPEDVGAGALNWTL